MVDNHIRQLGNCTGFPFTSTERYPVIPPFGIPDLAGWTTNRSRMDPTFFGKATHPIGLHFQKEIIVPRAFYTTVNNERFIYLSAPEVYTDYISNIPISGVRALVRG